MYNAQPTSQQQTFVDFFFQLKARARTPVQQCAGAVHSKTFVAYSAIESELFITTRGLVV